MFERFSEEVVVGPLLVSVAFGSGGFFPANVTLDIRLGAAAAGAGGHGFSLAKGWVLQDELQVLAGVGDQFLDQVSLEVATEVVMADDVAALLEQHRHQVEQALGERALG
jgi:hypothetical protein